MRFNASGPLALILLGLAAAAPVEGQRIGGADIEPGSEAEGYLRVLALRDTVTSATWLVRSLSPADAQAVARAVAGPWHDTTSSRTRRYEVYLGSARAGTRFNSAFPYGSDDGPIWAGRGTTSWASVGAVARLGALSIALRPLAWWAANTAFDLGPLASLQSPLRFADPLAPMAVDRPQRFGDRSIGRLEPGNSHIRVDTRFGAFGFSTAPEAWGPASFFPFLLGTNAPGIPHIFVAPRINLRVLQLQPRVLYGRLQESAFAYHDTLDIHERFASAALLLGRIPALSGLEFGFGRFFHTPLRGRGVRAADFRKPFEGLLKAGLSRVDANNGGGDLDNQLASVFAQWRLPRSGAEVYFEFGREDHSYDLRDFVLEPDHTGTRLYGIRKSWGRSPLWALRMETFNAEATHAILVRAEGTTYLGSVVRQGHTQRGQLLGADVGPGSAAAQSVALDRFSAAGRVGLRWTRKLRGQPGALQATRTTLDPRLDVQHAATIELYRRGRYADYGIELTGVQHFARNLTWDTRGLSIAVAIATKP